MEKDRNCEIKWSAEINEKVKILNSTKKMLEDLSKNEYFESIKNSFEKLNTDIENYIKDAKNPSYQIAIVGAIKAGKSTLINSLIGNELASVNVTPETASLTKFRYSEKNFLKTKFYTTKEWEKIWKNANTKDKSIFLEEYRELNAEDVKNIYLDKQEIFEEYENIEEMKKDIAKWTSSQEKEHYFVKELEIGLSDLKLPPQICLVDTPGLNDVIDYRSEITKNYIDSANAVLVCINAKTLRREEFMTIVRVLSRARYKKDKVYILGTQIDLFNNKEDWEKSKKLWVKYLKGKGLFGNIDVASEHIKGISVHAYSEGIKLNEKITPINIVRLNKLNILSESEIEEKIGNIDLISKEEIDELKNRAISFSNIPSIKNLIQKDLLENYNKDLAKDYKEKFENLKSKIDSFLKKHRESLRENKKQLEMSDQELEKELEKSEEEIEKIKTIQKKMVQKKEEIDEKINYIFKSMKIFLEDVQAGFEKVEL